MQKFSAEVQRAITAAGSVSALAAMLNIERPTIYSWRRIPSHHVIRIADAYRIDRHDLRPDLYPERSATHGIR